MYSREQLDRIYTRTNGCCHLCWKKLARTNYGRFGSKGAWEVEHSNPVAAGGTDHMNNLYAAHTSCNRSKQDLGTRSIRARHGQTRAPLSQRKVGERKQTNRITGIGAGVLAGSAFGPTGMIVGGLVGLLVGDSIRVK